MSTAMKLLLLVAASLVASCHGAFDTSFASKLDEIKKTLDEAQQDGIATSRHPLDNMDIEDLKITSRLLMQASGPTYPPPSYGLNMMDTLPPGLTKETARKLNFSVVMEGDFASVQPRMEPFMVSTRTLVATALGADVYRGQVEMSDVKAGSIVSTLTLLLDPTISEDKVTAYKNTLTTDSTIFAPLESTYGITSTTVVFSGDSKTMAPPRDLAASVTSASATTILAAFGTLLLGALLF